MPKVRARKIALNPSVHKIMTMRSRGGDRACDHDFDSTPTRVTETSHIWTCTRCAREVECHLWPNLEEDHHE